MYAGELDCWHEGHRLALNPRFHPQSTPPTKPQNFQFMQLQRVLNYLQLTRNYCFFAPKTQRLIPSVSRSRNKIFKHHTCALRCVQKTTGLVRKSSFIARGTRFGAGGRRPGSFASHILMPPCFNLSQTIPTFVYAVKSRAPPLLNGRERSPANKVKPHTLTSSKYATIQDA